MRKLGVIALVVAAFVLGLVTGSIVVARVAGRGMTQLMTQGYSADLITYVFMAAKLRTGDTRPVVDHFERQIDTSVLQVSGLPASQRSPGSTADKALRSAKLYRAVYPASSDRAAEVNKVLGSVSDDGPATNEKMLRGLAKGSR